MLYIPYPNPHNNSRARYYYTNFIDKKVSTGNSLGVQRVKDLVLSLLWYRFNPQPQNLCTVWLQPKRKKRKKRKRPEKRREEKKEGRASKQAQRLQSLPKVFEIRCQPTSPQSLSAFPYTVPPLLYNVTNILNSKLLSLPYNFIKKEKKNTDKGLEGNKNMYQSGD